MSKNINNKKQNSSLKKLWNQSNWLKVLIVLFFPIFLVFALISYILDSKKIDNNKKPAIITFIVIFMLWGGSISDNPNSSSQNSNNFENEFRACERQRDEILKQKDTCIESKGSAIENNIDQDNKTPDVAEENITEKVIPTEEPQQTGASLLPSREEAKVIVKASAEKKWEDDYSMVKYEIDNQMEAYDWLIKQNDHLDIMKKAYQKWSDDYSMVKYEYENQVEAYESI